MRAAVAAVLIGSTLLSGCGLAAREKAKAEFSRQVDADAAACRAGSEAACRAYELDIKRCTILSTDPLCQNM